MSTISHVEKWNQPDGFFCFLVEFLQRTVFTERCFLGPAVRTNFHLKSLNEEVARRNSEGELLRN